MRTSWTSEELSRIGDAEELLLASARTDQSLRPYVTMWVVRVGDDLYIRSADTRSASTARSETLKFTRAELAALHGAAVDDLIDDRVRLLFVGINPGLWTAAVNAHFARRGNRFWPALYAAGITPHLVDVSSGMSAEERQLVLGLGIGITNIVPTASARAEELSRDELRAGAVALEATVRRWQPRVVAVLGLTAYRQAFAIPKATQGRQDGGLAGAELWVLPNPSGLNAHETIDSLATSYRRAWDAADAH